ncbi:MAG: proton-conducting transporter membrane subunit [Chromatiaceae bacterium]|jgi:hydrogenase-4 component B
MNGSVWNGIAWDGVVGNYVALAFALLALAVPMPRLRRAAYVLSGWAAALLTVTGGAGALLGGGATAEVQPAPLAFLAGFTFTLDPVRGFFLIIAASVFGLCVAFVAYDAKRYSPARERALLALLVLLYGAMAAVLLAGGVLSFIFAWEVMSLALWALVTFDSRQQENVRAGYLTLALSEAGALAALAGLLVLAGAAGTWSLAGIAAAAPALSPGVIWAGFLLTFFGFGVKTGIVPMNVWMHDGYAAAPRSLTPVFSGATLNLGVFALWIIDGPLARHALEPALVVLVTGAVTALLGIVYALMAQRMTHLLTHSSIENLGIVVAALGAGFAFAALERPVLAGLALVAGLYHMLNHSAYKTLLFLGNGAIRSATGTDDLDALGGLMKRVPLFATLFLLGTFAIAALPPFNGFVSEWLTLESLLRVVEVDSVPVRITFALSGALLALTAGLALTCFVMLAGATLMGLPRSPEAAAVRRMPLSTTLPIGILTVICLGLGILATAVIPVLGRLAAPLAGTEATAALVPAFFSGAPALAHGIAADLTQIGAQIGRGLLPLRGLVVLHSGGSATPVIFAMSTALTFAVLVFLVLVVWGLARAQRRRHRVSRRSLWDAGLTRLRPEMTYTATAFAAPVRVLFDRLLRPVVDEDTERQGAFVTAVRRRATLVHVFDRLTLRPLIDLSRWIAARLARMHHGRVTLYAGYVLAALVLALLVSSALFT